MREYTMIELKNGNKYIIVDMINIDNNKYFLLAGTNGIDIDNYFDLCIYDEESNSFNEIDDEYEYNSIKEIFNNRLDNLRKELDKIGNIELDIIKLKVIGIDNDDYTFEDLNGNKIIMNIEIYDGFKLEIGDYLYIKESTTKENITIRFGKVYTDKLEIVKIIKDNKEYYLQRYYG